MRGAKVRWRHADDAFEVVGHGRLWFEDSDRIVGPLSVAAPASLTELRNALDRYRATEYDIEATLEVPDVSADEIEELATWPATSFELAHEHTFLVITQVVDRNERFDEMEIRALLGPLLKRNRLTFVSFDEDPQQFATVARATIEINPRGLTVGEAFQLGEEIAALWDAAVFGVLTPWTVIDLLRAGRTGVLIGQSENEWLEAKASPYLLDEDFAKLELAKDVAALANERHGGLLIVGLQTAKEQGKDVIRKERPVRLSMLNPARHRRTLDQWVYPRVARHLTSTAPDGGPKKRSADQKPRCDPIRAVPGSECCLRMGAGALAHSRERDTVLRSVFIRPGAAHGADRGDRAQVLDQHPVDGESALA